MGTTITIKVVKNNFSTTYVCDLIEEAFFEFKRIVKQYTRFSDNSELSNLNRNSGNWVKVTPEFFEIMVMLEKYFKETKGFFDPTIGIFLEILGYTKNTEYKNLNEKEILTLVSKISKNKKDFSKIEFDTKTFQIKLQKNQKIDLGGAGKGYAIDKAFERLFPLKNFLIDAGGDIRSMGKNQEGKTWRVTLKDKKNKVNSFVELENQALACSGNWAKTFFGFHHLINPSSGLPANPPQFDTVFVLADTAIKADIWATALYIGGTKLKPSKDIKVLYV